MTDIVSDFLERAKKAKGDPQVQAALAAEFALSARPEPERGALHAALDAAVLLHWFDADTLKQMLEISAEEALEGLEALKTLPFVERYRRTESDLYNVHEVTRLGWRRQMARSNPDGFRGMSIRAAACFAEDPTPAGRIEYIYHFLCGDPERGAGELLELSLDWISYGNARPEDGYALAAMLRELEDTALVQGRARGAALLAIGFTREMRGETAQLADLVTEVLLQAQDGADRRMESLARCLDGDVLDARGRLAAARLAFAEYLTISRQLAELDPSNAGWQSGLAAAHNRVGGVLQAQGQLEAAEAEFFEALAISRRLAELDPSNAGWQSGLAAAHNRVGGVLQAQGQLRAAEAEFAKTLVISQRLAELDQSNAGWQRDLAAAHKRVGGVLQAQGQLEAAEAMSKLVATLAELQVCLIAQHNMKVSAVASLEEAAISRANTQKKSLRAAEQDRTDIAALAGRTSPGRLRAPRGKTIPTPPSATKGHLEK